MLVAIDGTPLTTAAGGTRRYVEELARALGARFPEDRYWLVSDQPFDSPPDLPSNVNCRGGPRHGWRQRWWSLGLAAELRALGADLFLGADYAVPYLPPRASVMMVHDLSVWKGEGSARVRRRAAWLLGMRIPVMVATPSEAVRREVIERFRYPAGRVAATPLGVSPRFRPAPGAPPETPYFLYLGALGRRKNVEVVIEAWRNLRRRHAVELALAVGGARPVQPGEPRWLGRVDEADLPALYSGAVAALYPSVYEGFGLPVLEAMACGAPVVASRDAAVSEVAGGACVQADAADVRGWELAMEAMLTRPEWRAAWRERGLKRAALFSWEKTAGRTHEVFEEALRRRLD